MTGAGFKDHFSDRSEAYGRYRPGYPAALYDYLAGIAPARELAWDCATGNGQAARALAVRFRRVLATDASVAQLGAARPVAKVRFRVALAEDSGLAGRSVDLITVAQAAHWFDLPRFYGEVRRVLRSRGVLALWSYNLLRIGPDLDALLEAFYRDELGPYWPPERRLVEDGYRGLAFPFEEIPAPRFAMSAQWDLAALLGYLGTWSAAKACGQTRGTDPVAALGPRLAAVWGDPSRRRLVNWPLSLRVGRTAD